jgi:hypothetical protein
MAAIPQLADAISQKDLEKAAACFGRVAEIEASAYAELSKVTG